ncbi:MAG: flagellar biosynthesis anti-sigma factor FlgM [Heliobacteriaceae bacterium]|nr:flagellar biosynthesis anti-sigma factor FlgM [Heliobacteriaceae bacterium]MDD4588615.1 flagellar biosynthesis anti-sigma factor FlgM [Heliobacteriaceae bacterium]
MIISSGQIQNILKIFGVGQTGRSQGVTAQEKVAGRGKDTVDFSTEARLLQVAMKAVREVPEERMEKVAALREAVTTGTYSVSGEEIAEKMLGRTLMDRLGAE